MIRIEALGPIEVTVDDAAPPRELLWRKNLGLLLYLARSREHRRPRHRLTGLLWGDKPEADARHSLNEALRVIRKALPDGALSVDGDLLRLDGDAVSLDVDDFAALVRDGEHEAAVELVRGDFLEGFAIPDSNEFEDWLSAERSHWRRLGTESLVTIAERRLADGDVFAAREAARRAALLDPLAATPAATLVRCDAVGGDPSAALARYRDYADRLERELDLEPSAELQALAERIRSQREVAGPDLRAEDPGLSRRLPLAGRGEELKRGMAVLRACARESEPRILVVLGAPGAGKTRMAEEWIARARLDGFRVAGVRCDAADRDTRFGALRALTENTELFCDEPAWSDPEAFSGALALESKRGPVLVWIDDVHFLDEASWSALGPMMRNLPDRAVALLLSGSDAPPVPALDDVVRRLGRDLAGDASHLGPLSTDDLAKLAARALPDWSDDQVDRLVRRLIRDTAGIPMLVVDLLHALRLGLEFEDADATAWPEATHTLDDPFPRELPRTLVAAIRVGFRRLSPEAREVLKVAAVFEGRVTPSVVLDATDLDEASVLDALDELEWRRWLASEPRGYGFVARLHREVVATDLMTPGQRRRLRERLTGA